MMRVIRTMDLRIEAMEMAIAVAGGSLSHLDQSILAKAFRGELVPQDPADEPASALLERIRVERERAGSEAPARRPRARGKH